MCWPQPATLLKKRLGHMRFLVQNSSGRLLLHIENNKMVLFCIGNQLTGFYMSVALTSNGLFFIS